MWSLHSSYGNMRCCDFPLTCRKRLAVLCVAHSNFMPIHGFSWEVTELWNFHNSRIFQLLSKSAHFTPIIWWLILEENQRCTTVEPGRITGFCRCVLSWLGPVGKLNARYTIIWDCLVPACIALRKSKRFVIKTFSTVA